MSSLPTNTPDAEAKRAVAWAEAKRRGQFAYRDLASVAGVEDRMIGVWSRQWEADGLIRCIAGSAASRTRKRFEVLAEGEMRLELRGDAIDQMWTVMRKTPTGFTPTDLIAQVAVAVEIEDARAYCHTLLAAGYLHCVSKAVPKRREAVYRLVSATGVKAPRLKRLRCIVDQNTGKIIPMLEVRYG